MRPLHAWILILAVAATGGCNWKEFDDALAKAPVLSVGPGDDYKARDVGKVVVPLTVPAAKKDKIAARYLVAGTETPSLAVVDLDPQGHPHTHVATGAEIMDMAGEAKAAVKSAVELEDGRILLGTPAYNLNPLMAPAGRIYFLKLEDKEDGDVVFTLTRGNEPGARLSYGLAVAAGKIGGAATQDLVVASQTDVTLATDGNDATAGLIANKPTCPVNLDETAQEKYRFRALGVGDLIAGGGDEIAIGVPREATMPGTVVILAPGEGGLDCPLTIPAPGGQPRFGNALLVADVNGDGKKDLLVGAPPTRAYLYLGPFTAGVPPTPKEFKHPSLMDTQALGDFGFRVGAVDIDGMPGPEILVSAPDLPAHGELAAGQVFPYKLDGTALTPIDDNSPSANAGFGFTIQGIRFTPPAACGSDRSVLLVGADREVFTFFRLPGGPADPRCFD